MKQDGRTHRKTDNFTVISDADSKSVLEIHNIYAA